VAGRIEMPLVCLPADLISVKIEEVQKEMKICGDCIAPAEN